MDRASFDDNIVWPERVSYDDAELISAWFFLAGYETSKGPWMFPRSLARRGTTTATTARERRRRA
jgi:hypothetical protein